MNSTLLNCLQLPSNIIKGIEYWWRVKDQNLSITDRVYWNGANSMGAAFKFSFWKFGILKSFLSDDFYHCGRKHYSLLRAIWLGLIKEELSYLKQVTV